MSSSNFKVLYARHEDLYCLLATVLDGMTEKSRHFPGPYTAREAHEEARKLVNHNSTTEIADIHVFGRKLGFFIGARYVRDIAEHNIPWDDLPEPTDAERMEHADELRPPALLQPGEEPLPAVDGPVDGGVPAEAAPRRRLVRDVSPESRAASRTPPPAKPRVPLKIGTGEWPQGSRGAQLVRSHLEEVRQATGPEICTALAAEFAALGVQFPSSLISRLKQAGLLEPA